MNGLAVDPEPLSPDLLQHYFWEYLGQTLVWPQDRGSILKKLMEVGGWDAVQWIRQHVSADDLAEWITHRRGRGLSPERLRYWELMLDLPHARVNEWVATARTNPWYRRTAR